MSGSEDEEQPLSHAESELDDEENTEEASHEEEPEEVEDFDEIDVLPVPQPCPQTVQLCLPASACSGEKSTRVHVCLTRAKASKSGKGDDDHDEGERDSAAQKIRGCCAEGHRFESDYAKSLAVDRRRRLLRLLHGDAVRQRKFLQQERAAKKRLAIANGQDYDGEGGEEEEEEDTDAETGAREVEEVVWPWVTSQQPPPYWLPALLANDTATLQHVLRVMHGWVIPPEEHPADRLRLDAAGRLRAGSATGAEDEDVEERVDPAQHGNGFFLPSNAFAEGDEEGEEAEAATDGEEEERVTTQPPQRASKSLMDDFNECETLLPGGGVAGTGEQVKASTATALPPVEALPFFPFADYTFYIAFDMMSAEWHLLDTHPLLVTEACRRRHAAGSHRSTPQDSAEEEDLARGDANGDHSSDKGSTSDDDKKHAGPRYDLQRLVPVSPVILAALFSPAALRCCLLQPTDTSMPLALARDGDQEGELGEEEEGDQEGVVRQRVSNKAVLRVLNTSWLAVDAAVSLPILAIICRVRRAILQQDADRVPYLLRPLFLNVNPLLALEKFQDAAAVADAGDARLWQAGAPPAEAREGGNSSGYGAVVTHASRASPVPFDRHVDASLDHIVPVMQYGRVVLSALLAADIFPSRPVPIDAPTQLATVRLLLWWWMRLPRQIIRRWGVDVEQDMVAEEEEDDDGEQDSSDNNDDEEDVPEEEEEYEGMSVEDVTEAIAERVGVLQRRQKARERKEQPPRSPALRFSPLLQRVVLELQRRLDRLRSVDGDGAALPPSQFNLQESVARTFAVERLDSARPRQDPLVTSMFVGLPSGEDEVRHHRLYQSDLVLLLLALTSTPAPARHREVAVETNDSDAYSTDGHMALFVQLLEAKLLRYTRSPVERTRAGMTKLLLLCAVDFCVAATRATVFARLPSFELFGSTGYCPLPELVRGWTRGATLALPCAEEQLHDTVHAFTYVAWNELRWRLRKGQYREEVVEAMRSQLPELFTTVEALTSTYHEILEAFQREADAVVTGDGTGQRAMSMAAQRKSLRAAATASPVPPGLLVTIIPDGSAASAAAVAAAAHGPLTLKNPNVYSAEVLAAKLAALQKWSALDASPSTYLTAETLHVLLFQAGPSRGRGDRDSDSDEAAMAVPSTGKQRRFHTAALRVLFEHGVRTVQSSPLDAPEEAAIEAALGAADLAAVMVLVGLGAASLHELRTSGSATLETSAEATFTARDMTVLRYVEMANVSSVRSDPRVQFGARFYGAPSVSA